MYLNVVSHQWRGSLCRHGREAVLQEVLREGASRTAQETKETD